MEDERKSMFVGGCGDRRMDMGTSQQICRSVFCGLEDPLILRFPEFDTGPEHTILRHLRTPTQQLTHWYGQKDPLKDHKFWDTLFSCTAAVAAATQTILTLCLALVSHSRHRKGSEGRFVKLRRLEQKLTTVTSDIHNRRGQDRTTWLVITGFLLATPFTFLPRVS